MDSFYKEIIEDRIKYLEKLKAREDESDTSRQCLSFIITELNMIISVAENT